MRLFLIAALFTLTACQTLDGGSGPQTSSASNSRNAGLLHLVGCLRANDADTKIRECGGLIDSVRRIEPDPDKQISLLSTAHVLRASGYLDKNENDAAARDLDEAEQLNPDNAGIYLARSIIWQRKDDDVNMMRELDRAVSIDPDSAIVYAARANGIMATLFPSSRESGPLETKQERDALANARADIAKSKKLDPKYGSAWRLTADIHFELAEYDAAIGNYSEAIKRNSTDAKSHEHRGSSYVRISDTAAAIQDFESAMRLNPADPNSYVKLGWLLAASPDARFRDGNRAIELALKAERMVSPERPVFLIMLLPAAYAEAGRFDDAIREQERIVEELKGSALTSKDDDTGRLLGLYISAEDLLKQFRNRKPFRLSSRDSEA